MFQSEKQKALVAVHLLLAEKNGKILLLRRYNTGYEDGNYSVVAGHVDKDESVKQAMVREAREEAGLILDETHLEVSHVMHMKSKEPWVHFFLRARQWDGQPRNLEPHKCDHLGWFGMNELPGNIIPYIRVALGNIVEGVIYSELDWTG